MPLRRQIPCDHVQAGKAFSVSARGGKQALHKRAGHTRSPEIRVHGEQVHGADFLGLGRNAPGSVCVHGVVPRGQHGGACDPLPAKRADHFPGRKMLCQLLPVRVDAEVPAWAVCAPLLGGADLTVKAPECIKRSGTACLNLIKHEITRFFFHSISFSAPMQG